MLIRFFVENYLSFNEQIEFSMVPGKGRLFPNHKIKTTRRNGIDILKSAVIYGPNASGKSNFIKAISFAKKLIVKGTEAKQTIPVNKFKLDLRNIDKPSKFQFDFKYKEKFYSYGFTLDSDQIHEEWLYEINKTKEKLLFERKTLGDREVDIKFGNIKKNIKNLNSKEDLFLTFVGKGTRANQLFLTESIQRNVQYFSDVYEWFDDILTIIFPDSKYEGIEFFFEEKKEIKHVLLDIVQFFDTGISDIVCEKYTLEQDLKEIPEIVINEMKQKLNKKYSTIILSAPKGERFIVYKDVNQELRAIRLTSRHEIKNSKKKAVFDISEESDGTQRIIDFLPALINLLATDSVFVIDEMDRSLHPLLTRQFIELFLDEGSKINSQLIVTTHDSTLLDLKLLRKDEIWFIEKTRYGESKVYSLEEFKPRYDKNIQKGYLSGRFSAIPYFGDINDLGLKRIQRK